MKKFTTFRVICLMILSSLVTATFLYLAATPEQADAYSSLVNRLKGKILLRVEHKGEAWYVNPDNGQRYFMGSPTAAFNLMKSLGLGITDDDLFQISVAPGYYDETSVLNGYTNTDYSLQYPSNFTLDTSVPGVLIIKAQSGVEYMQIQVMNNINTAPDPSNYTPNGGTYQGLATISGKSADKYFTADPIGEGATLNMPNTHYIIDLGGKHWIHVQYYGASEISDLFEDIVSSMVIY